MSDFQSRFNELAASYSGNDTDIARLLGVTKQAVSNWRNGSRSPRKDTIIQIARIFNVSIEWLMGFDVPRTEKSSQAPSTIYHQPLPTGLGTSLSDEDIAIIAQRVQERTAPVGLDEQLIKMLTALTPSQVQRVKDFLEGLTASGKA